MKRRVNAPSAVLSLALLAALSLVGCNRGEGTGAPVAAQPSGTPNVALPQAPDGPPGGPSGVKGSVAHPGASGGDVMPDTSGRGIEDASGSGTQAMGNRSQSPPPGGGLNGGLSRSMPPGATTSSTQEGRAARGTPKLTPGGSILGR